MRQKVGKGLEFSECNTVAFSCKQFDLLLVQFYRPAGFLEFIYIYKLYIIDAP